MENKQDYIIKTSTLMKIGKYATYIASVIVLGGFCTELFNGNIKTVERNKIEERKALDSLIQKNVRYTALEGFLNYPF